METDGDVYGLVSWFRGRRFFLGSSWWRGEQKAKTHQETIHPKTARTSRKCETDGEQPTQNDPQNGATNKRRGCSAYARGGVTACERKRCAREERWGVKFALVFEKNSFRGTARRSPVCMAGRVEKPRPKLEFSKANHSNWVYGGFVPRLRR